MRSTGRRTGPISFLSPASHVEGAASRPHRDHKRASERKTSLRKSPSPDHPGAQIHLTCHPEPQPAGPHRSHPPSAGLHLCGEIFFSPLFSNQNRNNFQSIITISFLNRQMFPFKLEGGKSKGQHFKPKRKTKINFLFYRKIKYNSSKKPGFPFPKRTTNGTTGSSLPLMPP